MKGLFLLFLLFSATAVADPGPNYRVCHGQKLAGQIHGFLVANGAKQHVAREVAPLLARCKYPRVMAAIAIAETGCDPRAVGSSGEVSMFQILRWPGGDPTNNAHALRVAVGVLDEKLRITGTLPRAIRAYNGSGRKADVYQRKVLALVAKI